MSPYRTPAHIDLLGQLDPSLLPHLVVLKLPKFERPRYCPRCGLPPYLLDHFQPVFCGPTSGLTCHESVPADHLHFRCSSCGCQWVTRTKDQEALVRRTRRPRKKKALIVAAILGWLAASVGLGWYSYTYAKQDLASRCAELAAEEGAR